MASILDVAREANVAPSTVSLVMNHRGRVSPETRNRVDAVIRRLGYRGRNNRFHRPAVVAKSLRFGFVYTPDALVDGSESAYCREVIRGVEESLGDAATTLNIMRGLGHVREDQMFLQHLEARELNGLIIMGATPEDGYVDRVLEAGVPLVLINRPTPLGRYSSVTVDYFSGGVQAINHLRELGHERIGLWLRGERQRWPSTILAEGCMHRLGQCGLKPTLDVTVSSNWTERDVMNYARQFVDAGVTAIQTGDLLAVPLIGALEKLGLDVPDDISVMGFDDRGRTSDSGLRISTISYSKRHMGRMAGRILQRVRQPNSTAAWLGGAIRTKLKSAQTTSRPK